MSIVIRTRVARTDKNRPYIVYTDDRGKAFSDYTDKERLDAGETIFLANELEAMETEISQQDRPELDGLGLCPVLADVPTWAASVGYRTSKASGKAEFIGPGGENVPNVSLGLSKDTMPMGRFSLGAHHTLDDIAAAQALGMSLDSADTIEIFRGLDEFVHTGVIKGYAEKKMPGFFDNKLVVRSKSAVTIAPGGGSASAILAEMLAVSNEVVIDSKNVERPDTLAMGLTAYTHVSTERLGTTSDTTVLEFFLEKSPYIKQVIPMQSLDGINLGTGLTSTNVMVAFTFDPSKVQIKVTPYFLMPVERHRHHVSVEYTAKISGVIWKKPGSARIRTGI